MRAYASDFPFSLLIFLVLIGVLIVPKKQQTIQAHSVSRPTVITSQSHKIVQMAQRLEEKPHVRFVIASKPHSYVRRAVEKHHTLLRHHHIARQSTTHEYNSAAPMAASSEKLAAIVFKHNPGRGKSYARRIASLLVRNARAAHLPIAAVAATAAIESDFNMHSGPCIGMMQLNPSTVRERHSQSGLNPHALSDNIRLGVRELAYHYKHTNSHASKRTRLAMMWGHYNGAGSHSRYVRRAFRVYDAM